MSFINLFKNLVFKHFSNFLYGSLIGLSFLTVLIFYYKTPLRSQIEANFFDIKSKIKPHVSLTNTQIIDLDFDVSKKRQPISEQFDELLTTLLTYQPRAIAITLPPNYLEKLAPLQSRKNWHRKYKNKIYFGSFRKYEDLENSGNENARTPNTDFYYNAETLRQFRRQVVRSLPFYLISNGAPMPHIGFRIAIDHAPHGVIQKLKLISDSSLSNFLNKKSKETSFIQNAFSIKGPSFLLNYTRPKDIDRIKLESLSNKKFPLTDFLKIKNKVVVIGTTAFIARGKISTEGTYVNTPWQTDSEKLTKESSVPLHHIAAIGVDNLTSDSFLRKVPTFVNILISIILGLLSLLTWFFLSPSLAILSFITILILTLAIHVLLMWIFKLYIPFADTLVYCLITNTIGAFRYTHWASRLRELQRLNLISKQEIDRVQGKFLDHFSKNLAALNHRLIGETAPILSAKIPDTATMLIKRLHASANEFDEYLSGIQQVANLNKFQKPKKIKLSLYTLIIETLNQLDLGVQGYKERLKIEGHIDAMIFSDPLYLKPILFNFITNALKYSDHSVSINTEILNSKRIRIKVIDQGPGIPRDLQYRVFEKFYRIKNDNVYQVKGNGLGLFLTRFFAEKLNSSVGLLSDEGKGSTFYIDVERYRD